MRPGLRSAPRPSTRPYNNTTRRSSPLFPRRLSLATVVAVPATPAPPSKIQHPLCSPSSSPEPPNFPTRHTRTHNNIPIICLWPPFHTRPAFLFAARLSSDSPNTRLWAGNICPLSSSPLLLHAPPHQITSFRQNLPFQGLFSGQNPSAITQTASATPPPHFIYSLSAPSFPFQPHILHSRPLFRHP